MTTVSFEICLVIALYRIDVNQSIRPRCFFHTFVKKNRRLASYKATQSNIYFVFRLVYSMHYNVLRTLILSILSQHCQLWSVGRSELVSARGCYCCPEQIERIQAKTGLRIKNNAILLSDIFILHCLQPILRGQPPQFGNL